MEEQQAQKASYHLNSVTISHVGLLKAIVFVLCVCAGGGDGWAHRAICGSKDATVEFRTQGIFGVYFCMLIGKLVN